MEDMNNNENRFSQSQQQIHNQQQGQTRPPQAPQQQRPRPQVQNQQGMQSVLVQQQQTNGLGIAGFVLSLVALFVSWIPFFGWLVWLLGLVLSAIAIVKKPRGLAIAGLVIAIVNLVLFLSIIVLAFNLSSNPELNELKNYLDTI